MKLVDANVLLYAVNRRTAGHEVSNGWLTAALSGGETVGLPWTSLLAFVRISTNRRIFDRPLTVDQAMTLVEIWMAAPAAVRVDPTARHLGVMRSLLERSGTAGNLTTDAHLAALAIEHRAEVVTFDRDFERFGVPVLVPGA